MIVQFMSSLQFKFMFVASPPSLGWVKLNTDGASKGGSRSGCSGLIGDKNPRNQISYNNVKNKKKKNNRRLSKPLSTRTSKLYITGNTLGGTI